MASLHDQFTKIGQFVGVTGAAEERARMLLESYNWNLEVAINVYVDDEARNPLHPTPAPPQPPMPPSIAWEGSSEEAQLKAAIEASLQSVQPARPVKQLTLKDFKQAPRKPRAPRKKKQPEVSASNGVQPKVDESLISRRNESKVAIQLRVDRELAASRRWREDRDNRTYATYPDVDVEMQTMSNSGLWPISTLEFESSNGYVLDEFQHYFKPISLDTAVTPAVVAHAKDSPKDLSIDLSKLINNEWMSDMLIKSGFTTYNAHQLIWFTRTHKNNKPTCTIRDKPTVDLSDFSTDVIEIFLLYLYGGYLRISGSAQDVVGDLLSLAERLGCNQLVETINSGNHSS